MRIGRRSALGAAVLAGALILASCGDDDSGSGADTTAAAAETTSAGAGGNSDTTAASGGADTTRGAATTGGADTSAADDSTPANTDFSGEDSDEFCEKLREFSESPVLSGELSDVPEELEEQYTAVTDAIDELAEVAPEEIQADVATVQDNLAELIQLFEDYDYDFNRIIAESQTDTELAARMDALSSDEIDAASERLDAYGEQICGVTDTTTG